MKVGRYEVVRKLAAGGMCEIFLTNDSSIADVARPVVVKRLFGNYASQPAVAEMFRHEARVLAQLSHPCLPHVYEFGRDGASWFMAMEYVPGLDLSVIARGGTLPVDLAVCVVLQVLEGLAHAHSRRDPDGRWLRIVHRDVAPANVIVTDEGVVKLVDFGIASSADRDDDTRGTVRGTPGYIAPEAIAHDAPVGYRADLFAAGVILYEATLGQRLFSGNHMHVMQAVVEGDITRPSAVDPDYPSLIEDVVMQALARQPEDRFGSADEMAANLEAAAFASGHIPSRARLGAYMRERWFPGGSHVAGAAGADAHSPPRRPAGDDEVEIYATATEPLPDDSILLLDSPKRARR